MSRDKISKAIQTTFSNSENICYTKAIADIKKLDKQVELTMNRLQLYMEDLNEEERCKIINMIIDTSRNTTCMSIDTFRKYASCMIDMEEYKNDGI